MSVRNVAAALLLIACTPLSAQDATYSVFVDADNNTATGCIAVTPFGAFPGIEHRFDADAALGTNPQVTGLTQTSCSGMAFGAPTPVSGPFPYPIGQNNGVSGSDVVEIGAPSDDLGLALESRLYFSAEAEGEGDSVVANDTGGPIILRLSRFLNTQPMNVPTLGFFGLLLLIGVMLLIALPATRRHAGLRYSLFSLLLVSGSAMAVTIILDGLIGDWNGVPPRANDPTGDSTGGEATDIVAVFATDDGDFVYFRIDLLDTFDDPGVAADDTAAVLEDSGPTTIDVLANDTDPDGPLEIQSVTQPANGSVVIINDGAELTYQPDAEYCNDGTPTDDFTYTINGGDSATVRVTVDCVNDAPSFTSAGDLLVDMNAGSNPGFNEFIDYLTAIQAGPVNEAGQALSFDVTAANPSLFDVQPSIDPNGNLSFTLAPRAVGVTTLTIVAMDDGGTANGGMDTTGPVDFTLDVSCTVTPPDNFFSGSYLMEQLSGLDPFFAAETFGDTQVVSITADGFRRFFDFLYYPGIFSSDYRFTMYLCGGEISVIGRINAGGLGCGGANIGFDTGTPAATYDTAFDESSDNIVPVDVLDFEPSGNCDDPAYEVDLRFTEQ